jgi:hypothetical protein
MLHHHTSVKHSTIVIDVFVRAMLECEGVPVVAVGAHCCSTAQQCYQFRVLLYCP